MDILQPNDDVNNGGYLKSYKLLKSPKGLSQNFQKTVSQQFDREAYKQMEHPTYFGEAEKIIRYQAQLQDQEWLNGSTQQQVSNLDAMYENYYDGSKQENFKEFKLMKSVDKCLEKKLNKNR